MTRSHDDDICTSSDIREILRRTIATRHGRSCIHKHEGHRLADDIRPTDHDDMLSLHMDLIVGEEGHDTLWSTTPESRLSEEHIADLSTSEAIDIFRRIDTLSHRIAIDMSRKRSLHDDAMDFLIL